MRCKTYRIGRIIFLCFSLPIAAIVANYFCCVTIFLVLLKLGKLVSAFAKKVVEKFVKKQLKMSLSSLIFIQFSGGQGKIQ